MGGEGEALRLTDGRCCRRAWWSNSGSIRFKLRRIRDLLTEGVLAQASEISIKSCPAMKGADDFV